MSSLRKSASFRSRIPVRRTRLPHRRCTSPDQSVVTIGHSHGSESSIATGPNDAGPGLFGKGVGQQPKAWYDRSHCYSSSSYSSSDESYDSEAAPFQHLLNQSSVATSAGSPYQQRRQLQEQQQQQPQPEHPYHRVLPLGPRHPDGDQYQQFEAPFLPHHQSLGASSCLSTSTDAMSLDGLLDCVSTGTFSCPPSPKSKSYLDNGDGGQQSSSFYESLEELNYALKTLIISDSFQAQRNIRNATSASTAGTVVPPAVDGSSVSLAGTLECTVPLGASFEPGTPQHGHHRQDSENLRTQEFVAPNLQQLKREEQKEQQQEAAVEEDDDLIKQRKLSDWYYIKTAPSKKPSSPFERRRANGSRLSNEAAKRTGGRFPPTLTPRASNPDIAGDERLLTKTTADSKHSVAQGLIPGDRKYPSPVPRPRRLPPTMVSADSREQQHSWDQDARWHRQQHPGAVTKSASSSSVNLGLRGHMQSSGSGGTRGARLHSNSDLQQAGTRKAIAPALLQDDSLGSLDDSSSLAVLGGSLAFEPSDDRDRFSPYFRRRNPHELVPQWFPPPPPPPYHYPHQSGLHQDQRNIYENYPPKANQYVNDDEAKVEPLSPTPTARIRTTAHSSGGPHSNRPAPTLYGIEENEVFQYKVPLAAPDSASDKRPLPRPPIDSDDEFGQGQGGLQPEKKSSLTRCYPTKSQPPASHPPQLPPQPVQQKLTAQAPSTTTAPTPYRTDYELSGSYVSLECPSPPGPPACGPEGRRGDPQARLANYLRTLYNELALKEPVLPSWVHPVAPGVLCPARLEPELRLHIHSHGLNEAIAVDQILTPVQTKDGPFLEAPRRVLIECPPWVTRGALALRILHGWSREPPWPPRGQPVALALFLPLAELRGTIANYIGKELLPRGPPNPFASGFGGFSAAWNSLEALKGKLLIVLDGYDVQCKTRKSKTMPKDVIDLLEGRLFPEARVILISVTASCTELLPLMQRHITFEGLVWGRSVSLLGGGQWGAPTRLIDTVQSCRHLRNIARTTLGCLAIAAIYESSGGELPTDELDVIASVFNCVAANSSHTQVTELGRLALFCLKTKRSTVTSAELKMYCSSPETNIAGCLDRAQLFGRTSKRKSEYYYTIICPGLAEFLAANYIVSLANRPGLLAAEIAGLAVGDEVEPEILKVLNFSMALLGARAHLLLSKLTPLWLSPQTIFSLALAGGETEANLTALCEMLGISKSPPVPPLEAKPIWVSIKSTLSELQGWGLAFKSPTCTLKNLELVYQMEKNLLLESRNVMDIFLDALSKNESVTTLRITSLIENEVRDSDINYLASCISKALLKPRLESFELILTLLEEDPPILKLQSVVTALCRTIPRQPKLSNLSLDLGLCTSQLVQICATLEKCPHVTRLSLPHLRCERGAVGALAALLTVRPLSYLGLPSSWGARDDPPSSSGVSMGSGSGSSSGNSGLIKQSSLTGAPSPRSYPAGIFSSLPRGVLSSTANMGRSATLPRQPMEGPPDKRSTDSVISRTWYPTPACDGGPHNSGTLHELLLAARETYSRLHGLDLSKAQLSLEDSMCLGETVRVSTTLHSIKLEGASRLSEILPTVLGASESPSLQMMSLGSPRIALEDAAVGMSARALGSCITLRLLSLDGWSFRIENVGTLASVRGFLSLTSVRELGLNNCRMNMSMFKSDVPVQSGAYECRSVVNLKLAGAQIIFADHLSMKGPHMLPYLVGFVNLRELDLSAPSRTGFGSTSTTPLILSDKDIVGFFNTLNNHFSHLNTLKMCNWIIHLDEAARTLKSVAKLLKSSPLSHIKLDSVVVMDRPKKQRIEPQFLHAFLANLPLLRWLGITLHGLNEDQITTLGNYCGDMRGMEIDVRLSDSTIENARLMTSSLGMDGKFDIRVSTFGTSNSILIHIEKTSTKSLSRK
ncbi:uncharacterized protein LOC118504640 [Anopheles stephensi]|uniref:uncharacterized protein LOC118504640 n=1 Tax=Anopheles stephensi TaxID=30069 RepID=UPI001658A1F4|nr:uncharacterized protein LOC118504640 [Anopheles stephensi]XP_035895257.1 uncharacterized protein LOC118504640 [Anopheles stephensi]XP_035895258.1 uncharacterized protein LOC118504640 [Anopheles stephensi]XP_035895260.1 uncharacterized protein LOC118504640 [Anopheles stephensi]